MRLSVKRILLIIGIIIIAVILVYIIRSIVNSRGEIIYNTTYYFGFGSRNVEIYENGDVYDNIEIEDPNHKHDYKYLKTLTKEDIDNLKNKLKSNTDSETIKEYVIQLVYGVNEFDNFGNY